MLNFTISQAITITITIIMSPWLLTLGIVVVEALEPIGMKADVMEEGAIWGEIYV